MHCLLLPDVAIKTKKLSDASRPSQQQLLCAVEITPLSCKMIGKKNYEKSGSTQGRIYA